MTSCPQVHMPMGVLCLHFPYVQVEQAKPQTAYPTLNSNRDIAIAHGQPKKAYVKTNPASAASLGLTGSTADEVPTGTDAAGKAPAPQDTNGGRKRIRAATHGDGGTSSKGPQSSKGGDHATPIDDEAPG